MNVAELIASVEQQLDRGDMQVLFSRDDAMSLLSRLTAFKNLVDKGEDKTPNQLAAIQAQRADEFERRVRSLERALDMIQGVLDGQRQKPPTG